MSNSEEGQKGKTMHYFPPIFSTMFNSYLCFLSLYTVLNMSSSGPVEVSMLLQIWSTLMNVPVLPTPALQCTSSGPPPVLWVLSSTWVSWTRVTRWPGSPPPGADLTLSVVSREYRCTVCHTCQASQSAEGGQSPGHCPRPPVHPWCSWSHPASSRSNWGPRVIVMRTH